MKVAVIGPETFRSKLKKIEAEFDSIEFSYLIYDDYEEVAEIVQSGIKKYDGLLFSGLISYYIAKEYMEEEILFEIPARYEGEVMAALLQANFRGYDMERVSFDTYSRTLIKDAYCEIGIDKTEDEIIGMKEAYDNYQSNQMIYLFHKMAVESGKADICVTTHNGVLELLEADGIPCVKSERTFDTIRATIRRLEMRYVENHSNPKEIAVLCVNARMDEINEGNTYAEYQHIQDKMKIIEQIYLFAQRVQGAVIEGTNGDTYIFTTKQMVVDMTRQYTHFTFLKHLQNKVYYKISVGIGYGGTMFEAKANAVTGMMRSQKCGGNVVFLVYEASRIIGPLESIEDSKARGLIVEEQLMEVSVKSGVGMKYLSRIKVVMEKYKKNSFTSREIAEYCNLSVRSMDRVIEKLMDNGFACIAGMRTKGESGRPSRIIIFYI